ncbi:HAMP domain-containing histidine kinase [Nocardioides sp. zg-536]|uniref:histidine kinase n=1 Tax=Nocardioides faecalis TaxID=2803858 RepID=A0A938Y8S9_9ACTN|nr:HAMP domain-containing sensor histidine kinase [Nocardioides faecalis]MBM9460268.1 HAMP domain-containing histidine kinase [Nocardioides faecalis]QVI59891.1 HAMP domain-containing histidine kinase [Nocardioides faecalis]
MRRTAGPPGPGWPHSLASRLVVTAVALVAVVSLLIGTVTTLAMRAWLTDRLDGDVTAALSRMTGPRTPPLGPPESGRDSEDRRGFGVQVGMLIVFPDEDGTPGVVVDGDGELRSLESAASEEVAEVADTTEAHTLEVTDVGRYRVLAGEDRFGQTVVVGLPTRDVDDTTASLVRWEAVLTLLGVLAASVAGTIVVRRQLRPLTEVAATARAAAALPLGSGEIAIAERVPERLTDPRTEAGQVGAALNQLLAHVESSLSARHRSEQQVRRFVADASHELRTPLTTIVGYTELARHRGDPQTVGLALAKVEEEAGRMTALVEDMLLLARLDSGRPLAAEPVDLSRLLLEVVDDARVVAPDHRWQIELPADGEPVEVVGDPQRLRQVATNLLGNARKYTPAGTTVTVTVRPDGFDVHDDGPGFPPDLRETAFERFTRGDAGRQRGDGVGLGLALVQAIVAAHGGTVELSSVPGDTRIQVRLGHPEAPPEPEAPEAPVGPEDRGSREDLRPPRERP